MGAFKIFGLSRALILSCVRPVVVIHAYHEDDDEDQNNSNMEEFNRKRLAGDRYFSPLQAESGLITKSHPINILFLSTSPYL